ncbi:MAG: AmmeMemoRadiSam system radical SAM enzyme [Campylobacterales bacterium]|nr:AmmeMemoRadiSam system radical SAM enzyme [Campylobacterales bacterium]
MVKLIMEFFRKEKDYAICLLCSHYCKLKDSQQGICGVNQNIDSQIKNLVYGYPSAINIDPIEKKPLYHFLPTSKSFSLGTIGCNFKCPFCQNWSMSQKRKLSTDRYFTPTQISNLAKEHNCQSISYTYNEPSIFYPYIRDIVFEAKKLSIKNIFVSNGFESKEVISDMKDLIDGINVDLKSFNIDYYKKSLGGDLKTLLNNLILLKKIMWVEVTTLIVPTRNDSQKELREIGQFIYNELGADTPWHLSGFHPNFQEQSLPSTSVESLKKAYSIGKEIGLKYVYIGNVGLENPTICPKCQTTLIERKYFNVTKNILTKGSCPRCDNKIEGVFL